MSLCRIFGQELQPVMFQVMLYDASSVRGIWLPDAAKILFWENKKIANNVELCDNVLQSKKEYGLKGPLKLFMYLFTYIFLIF